MIARGTYCDLPALKAALGVADTSEDAALLAALEDASRFVDGHCARPFYVVTASRYYTPRSSLELLVDDLLAVTTLATDADGDRVYETVWQPSDYDLEPYDEWPKWRIAVAPTSSLRLPRGMPRGVEIAGLWGHGDGEGSSPWQPSGATITVADAASPTLTASDGTRFAVGQTVLVGTEQCYLTAIAGNNLTAERGVNGTTAAAHAAEPASIARYPRPVRRACLRLAARAYRLEVAPFGVSGSAEMGTSDVVARQDPEVLHWLAPLRRIVVA